ncbi:MAG: hypothetical protein JSR17_10335 [Proteobacteria bacterium]|nr:hypothetical protein [Pseudomonadota bacterium]
MFSVYVKHYLTDNGINYVKDHWHKKVYDLMSKIPGFIQFTYETQDNNDCVTFIVTFENQALFNKWNEQRDHDAVINELDPYRSRNFWAYANSENQITPSALKWEIVYVT